MRPANSLRRGTPQDEFSFGDLIILRRPLAGPAGRLRAGGRGDGYEREAEPGAPALGHGGLTDVIRGGGQPLGDSARDYFEPRFGVDFSRVRVHTGPSADAIARTVHARAFTVGRHVVFRDGEYAPHESRGRHLIAHELAHVLQQGATRALGGPVRLQRRPGRAADGDYGYGVSDDPLYAGGVGESALRVRPGPVRSTLIRPRSGGYATAWQAAFAALSRYNPMSILSKDPTDILSSGTEYGGLIYKWGDRYHFTPAVVGTGGAEAASAVDPWEALETVPQEARTSIAGDYHTHGAPPVPERDPREAHKGSGEDFSGFHAEIHPITRQPTTGTEMKTGDLYEGRQDLDAHRANILNVQTYTLFLGTPRGRFALYIPARNLVFSFSPDARLLPPGEKVPAAGYAR